MQTRSWITLALVVATLAVYLQVHEHGFLRIDDLSYVVLNQDRELGLGWDGIQRAFTTSLRSNWIPLTRISLLVDHALFGLNPAAYHYGNLAFHLLSTLAAFLLFSRMTGAIWPSAFVAGVFALHPLHVESVAWIAERKDVLAGLFWMLTLLSYLSFVRAARSNALGRYGVLSLCFICSLLSKPVGVTLPFVLLLLDYWPLQRLAKEESGALDWLRVRNAVEEKLLLFLVSAVFSYATLVTQSRGGAMDFGVAFPLKLRLANAACAYVDYIGDALWPTDLAAFYPYSGELNAGRVTLCALLLLAITAAALRLARSRPYFIVGWLWYLGTLVPSIGIIQVGGQASADRYMYLPLIGLSVVVAWGARDLVRRWPAARRPVAAAGCASLLLFAISSFFQLGHWRDSRALFERAIAVTQDNYFAHNGLASELAARGLLAEAEPHYREAIRIDPSWPVPRLELADLLIKLGKLDEAIVMYEQGLEFNPDHLNLNGALGLALIGSDREEEAAGRLVKVLTAGGGSNPARINAGMAIIAAGQGQDSVAVKLNREAVRLDPKLILAANNLAELLATSPDASIRDPEEAVRVAEAARLRSRDPEPALLETLALAYASAGRFDAAVQTAREALDRATARGDTALARRIDQRLSLFEARRAKDGEAAP
jgi:tetratricopeptide (TPR) repeat protein